MVQRRLFLLAPVNPSTTLAEPCVEQDQRQHIHPAGVLLLIGAIFSQAFEDLPGSLDWFEGGECRAWCELAGVDFGAVMRRLESCEKFPDDNL